MTTEIKIEGRQFWVTTDNLRIQNGNEVEEYPCFLAFYSTRKPRLKWGKLVKVNNLPILFETHDQAVLHVQTNITVQ
ncbi:MAG: hypothetical protein HY965_06895 [Ignavibacteriales bacterium]|nr:hypothetical protein [Ignavibacteriales bacterium]